MKEKEFWKNYDDADYFEKRELVQSLPLFDMLVRIKVSNPDDKESFEYILTNVFVDYFDDIIEYKEEISLNVEEERK